MYKRQIQKQVKLVREGLGMEKSGIIIPFSAETKQGRDEIWELIEKAAVAAEEQKTEEA